MTSRDHPAVRIRGLTRTFGQTVALSEVDLEVRPGEIRALLGPNGSGKTTLLRIVAGSVRPSAGTVHVGSDGRPGNVESAAAFGLVTSGDRSSYHRLSGIENLMFFGRLHGLSKRQARLRAVHLLEQVGLAEAATTRTGLYSHGMTKRLAMARALIMNPPVLLVDEATHDLDPLGSRMVRELLRKEAIDGVAVLWATQRIDEIQDTADTVTVLHRGEVRFDGGLDELGRVLETTVYRLETTNVSDLVEAAERLRLSVELLEVDGAARLILSGGLTLGEAIASLHPEGVTVTSCRPAAPHLEDAFLFLTEDDP